MFNRLANSLNMCISKCCIRYVHGSSVFCGKQRLKSASGRKLGSTQWLTRQINDPYVKLANLSNYRCRSAFKLLEIDDKYKIFHPGATVIDCGAAPGSWTQVAVERTQQLKGKKSSVIAVDLQDMAPIEGATILSKCDFTSLDVQKRILTLLNNRKVDVVLSDMAPSASGIKSIDHDQIVKLITSAFTLARVVLKDNGTFLFKLLSGSEEQKLIAMLRQHFKLVNSVKPGASRTDSAEVFVLCRTFMRTQVIHNKP